MASMCDICTESFNKGTRAKVTCPSCEFASCKTCVRTCLETTQSGSNPRCMNCNAVYPLKFLVNTLNRSWVLKKYKNSRTEALLDAEMSKMPDTMQAAETERARRVLEAQSMLFRKRIRELEKEKLRYTNAIEANNYMQHGIEPPEGFRNNLAASAKGSYPRDTSAGFAKTLLVVDA